jgi:hypothetical protein
MVSFKTLIFVKLLTLWNYLQDTVNQIYNKAINFFYYLKDYLCGHHDIWLFIPGHTIPLALNSLYNIVHVNWIYNNFDTTLTLGGAEEHDTRASFSWLSAKIRIIHFDKPDESYEYDIDDFLGKFSIHTISDITPSFYEIFLCWCTHTKHWFKTNDIIEFHVIDDMADEVVLSLDDTTRCLTIRNKKLYITTKHKQAEEGTGSEDVIAAAEQN